MIKKNIFSINKWNNLKLLLDSVLIKDNNYEIIENNILPAPLTINGKNYISILNNIWFKDKLSNSLIDLNIFYYFDFEKNEPFFYIELENKLIRTKENYQIILTDLLLDKNLTIKNKNEFSNLIKDLLINISEKITISTGKTLKKITDKNNVLLILLKLFLKYKLQNGNFNEIYYKTIKNFFNDIYFSDYKKEEYLRKISTFNKTFYQELNNITKKIKKHQEKYSYTIDNIIKRIAFKHRQLLIYGEKGTGKTYAIRKFVDDNDFELINIAGNSSVDELFLKGHLIRDYDGNFKWKYGKLSLAFKKAQTKKVIVFIDELLRLPEETFNMLITAMDSYNGYYYLDTGKPIKTEDEDTLETEEIKISTDNLWFVCATNMGNNYNVEELESAFKDRFILYYLNMPLKEKIIIIKNLIKEKGFINETEKIINFFKTINKLYSTGIIAENINLRHISDIILMSETEEDIPYIIKDKLLIWVDNDLKGQPIQEQVDNIKKAINNIWHIGD